MGFDTACFDGFFSPTTRRCVQYLASAFAEVTNPPKSTRTAEASAMSLSHLPGRSPAGWPRRSTRWPDGPAACRQMELSSYRSSATACDGGDPPATRCSAFHLLFGGDFPARGRGGGAAARACNPACSRVPRTGGGPPTGYRTCLTSSTGRPFHEPGWCRPVAVGGPAVHKPTSASKVRASSLHPDRAGPATLQEGPH